MQSNFMKRFFSGHAFLLRQAVNSLALCISDALVLWIGLYIGNLIIYELHGIPISIEYALALIPIWWTGAMASRIVPAWGLGAVEEFRRIQMLLLAIFSIAGIVVFLSRDYIVPSRIVYVVSYMFSAVFIPLFRIPVKKFLLAIGQWGSPTVLYGSVAKLTEVIDTFKRNPQLGYVPCGIFTEDFVEGGNVKGVPLLGGFTDCTGKAAVAIVPVQLAEDLSLAEQFDRVFADYRRVVLLPDIREDVFLWALPRTLGSLIGLEITCNLFNPLARIFKRGADLFLVILTAPLWLPLLIVTALLIWGVEHQNPFFIQYRIGKGNRPFRPIKFRTMRMDAEKELEQTLATDEILRQEWEKNCKLRSDPRITKLGSILRRISLDELPQVLNVLAGQMSLVGPRPLPDYHHEQLAESVRAPRSRVRPGITGLWQVSGRSNSGTDGMEKWDTYYVRNWSIWLDIIILARTFLTVIKGEGAY